MKDINKVILVGRLGTDPVQRETKSGIHLVQFPMATSRKSREGLTEEGEEKISEETQWHRIVAWGRQADLCAQYLKKGDLVYVEGFLRGQKYQGKDGVLRIYLEVHVENISFLNSVRKTAVRAQEEVVEMVENQE